MDQEKIAPCLMNALRRELAEFCITTSHLYPDYSLKRLWAEVIECDQIKDSGKRQVYYLRTPDGGYVLKRSILIRRKDRWRHFFLPRRRWAEWRNLHRLRAAKVSAASPVLKGQNSNHKPKAFFVLTEMVEGYTLNRNLQSNGKMLGHYVAYLHSSGVYHADLHPENIIIKIDGRPCLIDVQEVFLLPWLPRWLRVYNLGKLFFHLDVHPDFKSWSTEFLTAYNQSSNTPVTIAELLRASKLHRNRRYRSRAKRCCKNSTDFVILKNKELRGFKRRSFLWGAQELKQALKKGKFLKSGRVLAFHGVCIKIHRKRFFHRDRCLASWKMSRALEVSRIAAPRALGYFVIKDQAYFLSELMRDSLHLNNYLSALSDPKQKRQILKRLALWLRKIHDTNVWQRDFKSNNILYRNKEFFMIDLDDVKIRRLSEQDKIVNLAQLNASVSNAVTIKDRLRFYYHYSADYRPTRRRRRAVYRKVWDITKTKNTAIYDLNLEKL